jgi:hypothetical protein
MAMMGRQTGREECGVKGWVQPVGAGRSAALVARSVPSGFRVRSGGASPSAWRFQEPEAYQVHGLKD